MGRSALLPARVTFHLQWIMGQSRTWPASRTTLLLISVPFFFFLSFFLSLLLQILYTLFQLHGTWTILPFPELWRQKKGFVFWLPAVQENKLSVTKAKRAVVNHCLLCPYPLYRFAFFILLSFFFFSLLLCCCLCQYKDFSPSKLLSTSYLAHFDWGQDLSILGPFQIPKKGLIKF